MAINKTQLLEIAIRELSRDYFKAKTPFAAGACPVLNPVGGAGLTFDYQIVDGSGARTVGLPTFLTSETADLTDANIGLDTVSFALDQIDLGVFRISDSTADAFTAQAGGKDAVAEFMESLMSRAYVTHSLTARISGEAQLDAEILDTKSEDFKAELDDLLLRVLLRTGVRPNTILLDPQSVRDLSLRDFVRDFPAVAIYSGDKARTGYANVENVRAYFAAAHGLNLVVDENAWQPSPSDDRKFVWEGSGLLTFVGGAQDTLNTFVQTGSEIARYEVRRNSGRQRIGYSVAAEGIWKVHARNPETGAIFSTTGSSLVSLGS